MDSYRYVFLVIWGLFLFLSVSECGQGSSKEAKDPASKQPVKTSQQIKVSVSDIEVGTLETDGGKPAVTQKVIPPNKFSAAVDVAENHRLIVKFGVKNQADNQAVKPDQAFVRFTHSKADREVVLVADADGNRYKVELDLAKRAADFNRLSGTYQLRIDVGDVSFLNAISITVGNVKLNFPNGVEELPDPLTRFALKPEIKHLFREPEKRPPATVSTAFSAAVLLPFVILWALWMRLGINFKNLDFHPATLVFYGSLGAIFYLYYLFWIYLDMFSTLKYLTGLGVIAFFSGNTMFSRMNRKRTGKEIKE